MAPVRHVLRGNDCCKARGHVCRTFMASSDCVGCDRYHLRNVRGWGKVTVGRDALESSAIGKEQTLPPRQPAQGSDLNNLQDRRIIWRGNLEYYEKSKTAGEQKISRTLLCMVSIGKGEAEMNTTNWPQKLVLQLLPQQMLTELNQLFKNSRHVAFHFAKYDYNLLKNLHRIMVSGFWGCVHFPATARSGLRILLLLFSTRRRAFIGFFPNDQVAFIHGLKNVLSQYRTRPQARVSNTMMTTPRTITMASSPLRTQPSTFSAASTRGPTLPP